jgi:bifunctional UDP-N-acetylglucosamine pyrophosphorylase/glucosamine-1-phosphate N-acetyltransferase
MPAPTVVILAAGEGTRMKSATPKVLHPLCGRPLVLWPVAAAQAAGAARIAVVDGPKRRLEAALPDGVDIAVQEQARGTGDAVKAARDHFGDGPVVILSGDVPLVTPDFIRALTAAHEEAGAAATMATMVLDEPGGYGRVVRTPDGDVERVVEAKTAGDATPDQLAIREVNTGIFCFDGPLLAEALDEVTPDNAQGEYYLPDVLPILRAKGRTVAAYVVEDVALTLGVNDRVDLALLEELAQRRIQEAHMRAGVTIVQPASTRIEVDVTVGPDATIQPGSILAGSTEVGGGAVIGPHTTLVDTRVDEGATVIHSYLSGAHVGPSASVGPFAYLRPGAHLHEGAKAGTFVEIKNSEVGPGSKVPHLSYIGDTEIGEQSNIGAGTITANYDGFNKHRTTIGSRVRISVDTSLVAPVSVGDDAYTAAGSVITNDVPPGALGVARQRQRNIEGYAERKAPKER